MSKIPSDMIEVKLSESKVISLTEFISMSGESIPVGVFGLPVSTSSINRAIEYLGNIGGGTTVISPSPRWNRLKIRVQVLNYVRQTFFIYENYRQPLNNEGRPWTGEHWEVGDYVINSNPDSSEARITGWVCIERGTPGVWQACLNYGEVTDKQVITSRERASGRPTYGIEGIEAPERVVPIVLDVSAYTGKATLSALVSGEEYDTNNMGTDRMELSEGVMLVESKD